MRTSVRRAKGAPAPPRSPARPAAASSNGRSVRHETDVELQRLRSMFREVAENYTAKIEGKIAQICEELREQENGDCEETLRVMLASLRHLKIKPEKGRMQDLKRIHELVAEIRTLTETW